MPSVADAVWCHTWRLYRATLTLASNSQLWRGVSPSCATRFLDRVQRVTCQTMSDRWLGCASELRDKVVTCDITLRFPVYFAVVCTKSVFRCHLCQLSIHVCCVVCNAPIAFPPYGKLSASSSRHQSTRSSCQAEDGHIITQKGWCPKENNGQFWLTLFSISALYLQ